MILKVHRAEPASSTGLHYENMHVVRFPDMALFTAELNFPDEQGNGGEIMVTHRPPGSGEPRSLTIPLQPDTAELDQIDVIMHRSPTKAYRMSQRYNDWLSSCFGYEVVLAYLGEHRRPVLMSSPARSQSNGSWLSSIASNLPILGATKQEEDRITFADCAPFLIVSETSLNEASARLPEGEEMDVTKFRPNIVVKGAESAWEEDFWAEIMLGDAKLTLAQNCVRCVSINVDYATGKPGLSEAGSIMKKLQRDRRVDVGHKYAPVFGRYGFLDPKDGGKRIAVGDTAAVTKKNSEYTIFGTKIRMKPLERR